MPTSEPGYDDGRARARTGSWDAELWTPFAAVVEGRRAVRELGAEPIPEQDVRELLQAAILAPSSSNLQPYELCWVRSEDARRKLVRACMSQRAARTASELIVCIARWDRCDQTRRELATWLRGQPHAERAVAFYYDHLARFAYDQGPFEIYGRARRMLTRPLLLAVPLPRGPWSREDVRVWAVKSAALACENLMLAARAKGLDTCPLEGADAVRIGKIAGLCASEWRRTWDLTMVLAIGRREPGADLGPRWRRATEDLVREI